MWAGVFPAVTTKFTESDELDPAEMERCFALQMEAGCDGIIVAGSLGEGPMLSHEEKLEVLKTARGVAGGKPVLLTVNEPGTREACAMAKKAAAAGADGLMVVADPALVNTDEEGREVDRAPELADTARGRGHELAGQARGRAAKLTKAAEKQAKAAEKHAKVARKEARKQRRKL